MNFQNLKDFMDKLTEWKIPANSIIVNYKGNEVFRYSSGYADVEKKIKMKGDEWVNIYSCSKPVTCAAALQLFERGLFLLDDPISEYIPEFGEMYVKDVDGNIRKCNKPITFRHLFTMSAGLTYDLESDGIKLLQKEHPDADTVTVAKYIAKDPLQFEPGSRYAYSLCHDVLAALVEVISGISFGEYMKKNIFAPLGFENEFTYKRTPEIYKKMAEQYTFAGDDEKENILLSPNGQTKWKNIGKDCIYALTTNHESGGAGMVITTEAYAAFANAMANLGKCPNGERILSSGTVNLMRTSQNVPEARQWFDNMHRLRGYEYGLGVRTLVDKACSGSNSSLGEFGWDGAAGCYTIMDPDSELSFFYLEHIMEGFSEYVQPRIRNIIYKCVEA